MLPWAIWFTALLIIGLNWFCFCAPQIFSIGRCSFGQASFVMVKIWIIDTTLRIVNGLLAYISKVNRPVWRLTKRLQLLSQDRTKIPLIIGSVPLQRCGPAWRHILGSAPQFIR